MAPIKKIKCQGKQEGRKVQDKVIIGRNKVHDFKLNQIKHVQKKVEDASKALVRVEYKDNHIKIKPNSGNFRVLSTAVKKMKIGDEIKNENEHIAKVTDQHFQIDSKQVPFLVKTEFSVKDIKTGLKKRLFYIPT